jgi:HAD superfamily hydrolase (TIGR01509 family)
MAMSPKIEWVLFDWGNVLVEYRPLGLAKLAQRLETEIEALSQFMATTRLLHDLTAGALSPEAGIERIAQRFGVSLTRAQIAECFRADVEHELPGIRPLLAEVRASHRIAILSNAFFGHWDCFEGSELYRLFEEPMSSHLLGAAKPSPAAFEAALRRLRAEPERVVFIDDKHANVEAARAMGMHGIVTDSVATTRAGLSALLGIAA